MTEANGDRPLTRRQLRELERAAASSASDADDAAGGDPEAAGALLVDEPVRVGRHSIPSVPAAARSRSRASDPSSTDRQPAQSEPGQNSVGRLFGLRGRKKAATTAEADDFSPSSAGEPTQPHAVPAPSSARRVEAGARDVQGLDTVDEAELDRVEIDEVDVTESRVSAQKVSALTPAKLEDDRDPDAEVSSESARTGPSRGRSQNVPVIVNVVSDTSEHHIADLREQGVVGAGAGGASTSSFTANALVLPAGSETADFELAGDGGLLVTGSIDVPEGFATTGRGRAAIDGTDLDEEVADGEVTGSENMPVRASTAVSSQRSAQVQITPTRLGRNTLPIVLATGAGIFAVGIVGFLAVAFSQGWF